MGTYKTNYKTNYHFFEDSWNNDRNNDQAKKIIKRSDAEFFNKNKCSKLCGCTIDTGCKKKNKKK